MTIARNATNWDRDNLDRSGTRISFLHRGSTPCSGEISSSRWEMSMNCTMDDMLNFAEGKSKLWTTAEREGLVFKSLTGRTTFKVISNKFLLKNGD